MILELMLFLIRIISIRFLVYITTNISILPFTTTLYDKSPEKTIGR